MRRRKQITAAVLTGAMVLSLSACGSRNTAPQTTEAAIETEVEASSEAQETEKLADGCKLSNNLQ